MQTILFYFGRISPTSEGGHRSFSVAATTFIPNRSPGQEIRLSLSAPILLLVPCATIENHKLPSAHNCCKWFGELGSNAVANSEQSSNGRATGAPLFQCERLEQVLLLVRELNIEEHPHTKRTFPSPRWLVELLRTGLRRQIGTGDIYQTLSGHRSEKIGARFSAGWMRQVQLQLQQTRKPENGVGGTGGNGKKEWHRPWRLLKVVFKIYGPSVLLFGGIYSWLESACR